MEKDELENRIKELEFELSLLKSGKVESPLLENESSFYNAGADPSEQKKVENVLKESEEKFKLIFEKSIAPIIVADDKGNYLEVNKAAAEIFEYSINELMGMNVGDLITTSNPNAAAQYEEYIKKGEEIGEFGFISKKGTPKIVQYQAVRIKPDFNLSILMDVTEQKQASQYARSLIEASLDPLVTINADGKITDVNEASIKVTGVEREKLIDTDFSSYFTEPQKAQEGYQQVFEKGFVADYPLTIKHKNGNLTYVLYNASVYKDDKGNVLGVFAASRDITDAKKAETALRKKTQTLAVGSAVAGLAIIEIDYATNLAHLRDEAAKMYFGPDAKAQVVSRERLHETFHPDNLEHLKNLIEKSLDPNGNGLLHIDHRVIWPNGEVRWLKVSKQVFFNRKEQNSMPEYSILAAQDITNIKEAQEKLQASEERIRLATKASGVGVWEWNVITNKIRWDAQMFRIYGVAPTADGLIEYSTWSNAVAREDLAAQEKILQDTVKNVDTSNRSFKIYRANDGMQCFIEAIETVRINAVGQAEWVVGTNLDVTEQKQASQYARSLIEASLDPLVTINADGKITDVNEASIKVTGVEREKLIDTDFSSYFTEPQKAQEGYQRVFEKGFVADYPLTIKHKNGNLTDVLYNASVYKDDKGNVLGVFAAARDVTERKMFEKEMIDAKVSAENATKSKQQFLSNMSHEIRTPLNSILGFTNVLLKTELGSQQKEFVEAINTSGKSLNLLINDILDLAKVDAGKMTFEKHPIEIRKSISAILHSFDLKIKEKNLELAVEHDSTVPSILLCDSLRLNQIFFNLLSNAIKFTHKGKIKLTIKLLHEDKENVTIEFVVSDSGIGIADDKLNSIFNLFEQAEINTSTSYGGTGLGLSIVKQLVEGQGGSVSVKSKLGEGSTFIFILPFGKANLKTEEEIILLNPVSEIKNLRVLVAEDVALNQLLIKIILNDFGFEHEIVGNGKLAIEKMHTNTYDIILMDLHMPEMNGFEATEYIRKILKSHIPIIALTADVTTMDVSKCKEFGMDSYISKPIEEKLLYNKIVELVKNK
jgi:PAS domain S-box-containing protein